MVLAEVEKPPGLRKMRCFSCRRKPWDGSEHSPQARLLDSVIYIVLTQMPCNSGCIAIRQCHGCAMQACQRGFEFDAPLHQAHTRAFQTCFLLGPGACKCFEKQSVLRNTIKRLKRI